MLEYALSGLPLDAEKPVQLYATVRLLTYYVFLSNDFLVHMTLFCMLYVCMYVYRFSTNFCASVSHLITLQLDFIHTTYLVSQKEWLLCLILVY